MNLLVQVLILSYACCQITQGGLTWIVVGKVTDYGQNVTLFCNVSNCCPTDAGWDRWNPVQRTIYIDVKTGRKNKKYDGKVLKDGYTLVIQNLTREDLNVSYSCLYGVTLGERKFLLEEDVFREISTKPNGLTVNNRFSEGKITGIILGVVFPLAATITLFLYFLRKRRTKRRRNRKDVTAVFSNVADEDVPLVNYFIEDTTDIDCEEGDDAVFTCKVKLQSPSVTWFKNGNEIIQNKNCIQLIKGIQHKLILKNTTPSDSGEYSVKIGSLITTAHLNIKVLPKDISMEERSTYLAIIKSKTEIRKYVRIQVIGKDRVGKTSLVQRLLNLEDGAYNGKSTDGIEIDRKCQIRTTDGKWFVGDVDTPKKELIRRIQLAVYMDQSETDFDQSKLTSEQKSEINIGNTDTKQNEKIPTSSTERLSEKQNMEQEQNNYEPLLTDEKEFETEKNIVVPKISQFITTHNDDDNNLPKTTTMEKQTKDDLINRELIDANAMSTDQITDKMIEKMGDILSRAKLLKDKRESENLVECGIWDFAGQKDYYATHQTFFTQHAIYLLVTDVMDDLKPITQNEDDCYCIEDYIDFWFDSVHCFCEDHSAIKLCPPVIMVCAGIDKFEKIEDKKKYTDKLRHILGNERKFHHNRGIFFISNTQFTEEDKSEIIKLRKHISDIALEMNYFAKKLPTKWIQLESALEVLKDADIYVYSWDNMEKLANKNCIEKEELFSFLIYQHGIGNVIFFQEISDYIILKPDWLVRCFRCLVCDCHKDKINYNIICPTAWIELRSSGRLSDILLNQLFQKEPELKFEDHKTHLLKVMEKFDIVIKLQVQDNSIDNSHTSECYILPCMIENSPPIKSIMNEFIPNNSDDAVTPWLVLEFKFLPLAFFNHILFHYIRTYKVCKVKSIYRGKSVFYLDELSRFIICFSHNAISVQIWKWGLVEDIIYENILNELCDNIENIQGKLRHTVSYTIKAKCGNGDYNKSDGRIALTCLKGFSEQEKYFCEEHRCPHCMDDIKNTWLNHATNREKRNIIRKEREALKKSIAAEKTLKMEQFQEDNRRLKEENGALIRVISKLSK